MMKKTIFLIIILYTLVFISFAYKINAYKVDNTTKTDAIIVLTGGKNRIEEGAKLKNNNMAKKLFISGVNKNTSKKDLKTLKGTQAELGYSATTTFENALEVKEWINKNNIKTIRLVTSNYHLPRAMQEIKEQNKDIKIIKNPIYSDNISPKWWKKIATLKFIFIEFNKYLYVYLRNLA